MTSMTALGGQPGLFARPRTSRDTCSGDWVLADVHLNLRHSWLALPDGALGLEPKPSQQGWGRDQERWRAKRRKPPGPCGCGSGWVGCAPWDSNPEPAD